MRIVIRLLTFVAGAVTVVAVIQAFNGAPWWVPIAWGALALVLSFLTKLVPPNKTVQLALVINQGGLEKRSVAAQVEHLLRRGANPNGLVGEARILNEATVWGEVPVLQSLLDHGADVDGRDLGGWTAVHVAQNNDRQDLARLLVGSGANVNAQDKQGCTPLHLAASRGDADVVRWLIELGASARMQDNRGLTALAEAENTLSTWVLSPELSQNHKAVSGYRATIALLRTQPMH